jgi:hypothetical protein
MIGERTVWNTLLSRAFLHHKLTVDSHSVRWMEQINTSHLTPFYPALILFEREPVRRCKIINRRSDYTREEAVELARPF